MKRNSIAARTSLQGKIDPSSAPLTSLDRVRLASASAALSRGLALKDWWLRKTGPWGHELTEPELRRFLSSGLHLEARRLLEPSSHWPENLGYVFSDRAMILGQNYGISGRVQQLFFDQPMGAKTSALYDAKEISESRHVRARREVVMNRWRDGLRHFVTRYLLCSSRFTYYAPFHTPRRRPLDDFLRPFSWSYSDNGRYDQQRGTLNQRIYYQRRDNGALGKFREIDRAAIDLQQFQPDGEFLWIVMKSEGIASTLRFSLPGESRRPYLAIPLSGAQFGVMSPEFSYQEEDTPSHRGLYTFGFAHEIGESPRRDAGFSMIQFLMNIEGRILVRMVQVTTNFQGLHPFTRFGARGVFARLMNRLTDRWVEENLSISLHQLEMNRHVRRAMSFMDLVDDLVNVWRAVPDWVDEDELPAWAKGT